MANTCAPAPAAAPAAPAGSHRDVGGARQGAMLYDPTKMETIDLPSFALRSGPRKTIYHNPKDVTAAIVTCEHACMHACRAQLGFGFGLMLGQRGRHMLGGCSTTLMVAAGLSALSCVCRRRAVPRAE